ncbi:MAG: hypothetical protein WBA13_18815 [Microcoleaceae cyanobacterium]
MSIINSAKNALLFTIAFSFTAQLYLNLITIKINQTSQPVCWAMNWQSQDNNNFPFNRDKDSGGGRLFESHIS